MPNYSLLFAADLQDADDTARKWGWQPSDPLHFEFRRPSGERVRFVQVGQLQNFRWRTTVYVTPGAQRRTDIGRVVDLIMEQFFVLGEPTTPRRPRVDRKERLRSELKDMLRELGGEA